MKSATHKSPYKEPAAFGRLCVETITNCFMRVIRFQPPSGGCVLKHEDSLPKVTGKGPAAFGRLCVETQNSTPRAPTCQPAAFGRLCVETPYGSSVSCRMSQPPSGGCVLKRPRPFCWRRMLRPAAFGRLCVETGSNTPQQTQVTQPPSGGCVLKLINSDVFGRFTGPAAFGRLCVETLRTQDIWFC